MNLLKHFQETEREGTLPYLFYEASITKSNLDETTKKNHRPIPLIPVMQEWFNISKCINVMQHINRSKDKSHMIFSIDAEKSSNKIQH
jgi:hypothetical protein